MQILKADCPNCGQAHDVYVQPAVAPQVATRRLITVEYWPHTAKWRILVAGVAVGYWEQEEEARMRARQVRRGLIELTEPPFEVEAEEPA